MSETIIDLRSVSKSFDELWALRAFSAFLALQQQ